MALETLENVKKIGEFTVDRSKEFAPTDHFVQIVEPVNAIMFKLQKGPVKEAGLNGCQVDTLIETALLMLKQFQVKLPCFENKTAISKLTSALHFLELRNINRVKREVEGTSKA